METLIDFVKRISAETKCFFHVTKSGVISLKKNDTFERKDMGCLGWVSERKRQNKFCFQTSKNKAFMARVTERFDVEKENIVYAQPGLELYVDSGSHKGDYKNLIDTIKIMMQVDY